MKVTFFIIFLTFLLILTNICKTKENFLSESLNLQLFNGGENFGDSVNKVFWNKFTGKKITNNKKTKHYLTTGSIMAVANNNSIIFGTGFISDKQNLGGEGSRIKNSIRHCTPKQIISVRGPKSRQKLLSMGLDCPENYGDPLILFPSIYTPSNLTIKNKIGIIPHYIDFDNKNVKTLIKNLEKQNFDVKKINILVGEDYKKFIDEINECETIISSSLHGVIMGLVYKKKTIQINFSNKVIGNNFKFNDFYESVGIDYKLKNNLTHKILDNPIILNYKNLIEIGTKLIRICPFISNQRKHKLTQNYISYYK